jgi:hypothetical protein
MCPWSRCVCRSNSGEPSARVFTEKEEMKEVIDQVALGSQNKIRVYLLGREPIPFYLTFGVCQLEPAEQMHQV